LEVASYYVNRASAELRSGFRLAITKRLITWFTLLDPKSLQAYLADHTSRWMIDRRLL
jgi:hypothetical protein